MSHVQYYILGVVGLLLLLLLLFTCICAALVYLALRLTSLQSLQQSYLSVTNELKLSLIDAISSREFTKQTENTQAALIRDLSLKLANLADPKRIPEGYKVLETHKLEEIKRQIQEEEAKRAVGGLSNDEPKEYYGPPTFTGFEDAPLPPIRDDRGMSEGMRRRLGLEKALGIIPKDRGVINEEIERAISGS